MLAHLLHFFRDAVVTCLQGTWRYYLWMGALAFVMILGAWAYTVQLREGLQVTGMNDHVSWGLYISNFTFLVGLAAAAVMLVLPAYILHDMSFHRAVLVGEGVAVAALIMCMAFVTVDLGAPFRIWHMFPGVGLFNFPNSMLAWDVLVLNGYLALNLAVPFYILFAHYRGQAPNHHAYVPFVILSVFWAVAVHMVTAFLLAGLPARPFWNTSLLGPRFLASAFAAGPAFMILVLGIVRHFTHYQIRETVVKKLALIVTVAAQVNLVMLLSELFKEFYWPTHPSLSATYLFFGLDGHGELLPYIWPAILLNLVATATLTINPLRGNAYVLYPACLALFIAIWTEKGIGLVIPGFIPSPLGEIVAYTPTLVEILVTLGIWAMGLAIMTLLVRVAIAVELGQMRSPLLPSLAELVHGDAAPTED